MSANTDGVDMVSRALLAVKDCTLPRTRLLVDALRAAERARMLCAESDKAALEGVVQTLYNCLHYHTPTELRVERMPATLFLAADVEAPTTEPTPGGPSLEKAKSKLDAQLDKLEWLSVEKGVAERARLEKHIALEDAMPGAYTTGGKKPKPAALVEERLGYIHGGDYACGLEKDYMEGRMAEGWSLRGVTSLPTPSSSDGTQVTRYFWVRDEVKAGN